MTKLPSKQIKTRGEYMAEARQWSPFHTYVWPAWVVDYWADVVAQPAYYDGTTYRPVVTKLTPGRYHVRFEAKRPTPEVVDAPRSAAEFTFVPWSDGGSGGGVIRRDGVKVGELVRSSSAWYARRGGVAGDLGAPEYLGTLGDLDPSDARSLAFRWLERATAPTERVRGNAQGERDYEARLAGISTEIEVALGARAVRDAGDVAELLDLVPDLAAEVLRHRATLRRVLAAIDGRGLHPTSQGAVIDEIRAIVGDVPGGDA